MFSRNLDSEPLTYAGQIVMLVFPRQVNLGRAVTRLSVRHRSGSDRGRPQMDRRQDFSIGVEYDM
jgi:hypothetical protein